MGLTQSKVRVVLRWLHIILGLVIMCYVYSPFHEHRWFQVLVKFGIIPIITFTGIWLWKFAAFNKIFHIK